MKGLRVVISGGRVQEVGYRIHLLWLAESLGIERFQAANIEEGVEVLVAGSREQLDRFLSMVKAKKPPHAEVGEIRVEEYVGPIPTTEAYYRLLSLEQLAKIVNAGISLLEKQDRMLEKQDEMMSEIRMLRKDLREILDQRLARIEKDIERIKAKLGMI